MQLLFIDTSAFYAIADINIDKEWSFTDCTSYVVMKQKGITEAFTLDRHFTQMGFVQYP